LGNHSLITFTFEIINILDNMLLTHYDVVCKSDELSKLLINVD
jgi:hypothetical protein